MTRVPTIVLQVLVLLIGVAVLTFLLGEPLFEGRNFQSTVFQVYFNDPFLAYAYLGSIPFFVALYQAFLWLRYVGRNEAFALPSVRALRTIKVCALLTAGLIVCAVVYIILFHRGQEDIAGGVAMGVAATLASLLMAVVASVLEHLVTSAPQPVQR